VSPASVPYVVEAANRRGAKDFCPNFPQLSWKILCGKGCPYKFSITKSHKKWGALFGGHKFSNF